MKRLLVLLFCFISLINVAYGNAPATPTDLEDYIQIEDDDFGCIEFPLERKVFLQFLKEPSYLGEEVTLVAILMDFRPMDIYTFIWEYSEDGETWYLIPNENEQTYTFTLDETNVHYSWRVQVILEEIQ